MGSSTRGASYRLVIAAMLALVAAVLATVGGRADSLSQDERNDHECVSGYGYWKTHRLWPVRTLVLGSPTNPAHIYTQSELQQILDLPATGDASIILAYQLIAAKLNVARGSNPSPIANQLV